jgi:hypothetical protein
MRLSSWNMTAPESFRRRAQRKTPLLASAAPRRWVGATLAVTVSAAMSMVVAAGPADAVPYTTGDVFVSVGNGLVEEFTPAGAAVQTLDTTTGTPYTTGSAFDAAGNFYVTDFAGNAVSKFDTNGTSLGAFGSGYNADPESIVFDDLGNAYVGQADGTTDILKFDTTGAPVASYTTTIRERGTDWIDLAADQCTIYYDSEGPNVHRFNVCTNTQLTDFTTTPLPGTYAYALRILPGGGALVADNEEIVRLDGSGAVVQTYTAPNDSSLFALNLDPDGTSFWTADLANGDVVHFDSASGAVLGHFNGLSAGGTIVAGLAVRGEVTAAHQYGITLTPTTGSAPVGTTHTVTATTSDAGAPLAGQTVHFSISAGPNTGQTGTGTTDATGQASFTYTGSGGAGTDTIGASFTDPASVTLQSSPVTQTWTAVNQPPILSAASGTVQYSDPITPITASATDPDHDPIALSATGLPAGLTFTDNHNGTGTISGTATAVPAAYTVTYSASDGVNPATTATGTVTVTKEDCTLTSPATVLSNAGGLTALGTSMGEPDSTLGDRSNKTITFSGLDSSLTPVGPFTATTDANGNATTSVPLGAGVYSIDASFAGDAYYKPCSTTTSTIVTVSPAQFKVTGGGWLSNSVGRTSFGFNAISDVTGLHGQLQVRTNAKGNFHGNVVLTLTGTAHTAQWSGTGTWNGMRGYRYAVSVLDAGTSGKNGDTISITITNPTGTSTVFTTGGAQGLKGGNIVVH